MAPFLGRLGNNGGTISGFGFGRRKPPSAGGGSFSGTGGNIANGIAPGNGYKYHTFGAPGSFIAPSPGIVDMLVIGGGGAGHGFGGGGAGAVVHVTSYSLSAGTYPIAVGDGGTLPAGPSPSTSQLATIQGKDTTFGSIVTAGGGGASQEILYPDISGRPGGSGGGGDGSNSPGDPGGSAVNPGNLAGGTYYGNGGGNGGPRADGGGGGGAGGGGTPDPGGGTGGPGRPFPAFAYPLCFPAPYLPGFATPGNPKSGYVTSTTSDHYGGGGGGSEAESGTPRSGGAGGGGASSFAPATNQQYPAPNSGKDGLQYLGAGGGGGQTQSGVGGNPGGQGGKGVVIIRYLAS